MTLKIMLSLLLSLSVDSSFPNSSLSPSQLLKAAAMVKPKSKSKIKKNRFRWKKIFRPIKIFNKKISIWWFLFFAIAMLLGVSFYWLDRSNISLDGGLYRFLAWIFLGVFSVSILIVTIILIALPIVWISRIIKEIKWNRRYRKCYKF